MLQFHTGKAEKNNSFFSIRLTCLHVSIYHSLFGTGNESYNIHMSVKYPTQWILIIIAASPYNYSICPVILIAQFLCLLCSTSNVFTALVWWDFKTIIPIESLVMKSQPLRDGVRDPVLELSHGEGSNKYKGVCNTKQNFRPKPSEQLLKQHLNLKAALLNLAWEYSTKINHREHSFLPSTPTAPYMLLAIHVGEMPASAVHSHFMLPPYSFPPLLVLSLLLTVFSHFLHLILWTSHLRYLLSPDNLAGEGGVLSCECKLTWPG